jgi:uncharacterized protein YdbL (DUF1318 family)
METPVTTKPPRQTLGPLLGGLLLAGALAAPFAVASAGAAYAQAAAKGVVDTAKARGEVGEQPDGFLGLVRGGASGQVAAAVAEINAGRREAYREAAARTGDGATAEAAGDAMGQQLIRRTPPGQFYRNAAGQWVRK